MFWADEVDFRASNSSVTYPMAIFYHYRFPIFLLTFWDILVECHEVNLSTTSVQFPGIETVLEESSHILLDLQITLLRWVAMITTNTVVSVPGMEWVSEWVSWNWKIEWGLIEGWELEFYALLPSGCQSKRMSVIGHFLEIRKSIFVHDGISVLIVIMHSWCSIRRVTFLPIIIQTYIAISQIAQWRQFPEFWEF